MSVISKTIKNKVTGDPVAVTSVKLSSYDEAYGVKRNDTGVPVVADGTAMTYISAGRYRYEFDDPADDLTYTYCLEIVYSGETYWITGTITGPTSEGAPIDRAQYFLARVREEMRDPNGENFEDNELFGYVNEAVDILWSELGTRAPTYFDSTTNMKEQALTIETGTPEYSLESDFHQERMLVVGGDEVDKLDLEAEADADAEGYLLQQGKIKLFPSPSADTTGTFYYICKPTVVDAMGDSVPLAGDFAQEIKKYVVGCCKARHEENMMGAGVLEVRLRRAAYAFAIRRNAPEAWGPRVYYPRYY